MRASRRTVPRAARKVDSRGYVTFTFDKNGEVIDEEPTEPTAKPPPKQPEQQAAAEKEAPAAQKKAPAAQKKASTAEKPPALAAEPVPDVAAKPAKKNVAAVANERVKPKTKPPKKKKPRKKPTVSG